MKKCKDCVYMHIHPISVKDYPFYQCLYNKKSTHLVLPEFECNNFKKKPEQKQINFD